MSEAEECLHCEINDLVQDRLQRGETDYTKLTSMMVESLADLIVLAPESDHARLMADALAQFGHVMLERTGAMPGPEDARH